MIAVGNAKKKFKFVSTALEKEEHEPDSDDVPAPLYAEQQYQYPGYNQQGIPMQQFYAGAPNSLDPTQQPVYAQMPPQNIHSGASGAGMPYEQLPPTQVGPERPHSPSYRQAVYYATRQGLEHEGYENESSGGKKRAKSNYADPQPLVPQYLPQNTNVHNPTSVMESRLAQQEQRLGFLIGQQ